MSQCGNNGQGAPSHYARGGLECVDVERAMLTGAEGAGVTPMQAHWWCAALEYLWRWPFKGRAEDLRKCAREIDWLIESLGGDGR